MRPKTVNDFGQEFFGFRLPYSDDATVPRGILISL